MRCAAKRDDNEADIVSALETVGASVQRLNDPGCPDLLVAFRGALMLLEVKQPKRKDGRGQTRSTGTELTPAQQRWWLAWKGPPPEIVRTMDEALRAVGART